MNSRAFAIAIIAIFLFSILVPSSISDDDIPFWNENWDFRQEIIIPVDTSKEQTHMQPIDIEIDFENDCWAENEKKHSVRVIYQKGGTFKELESQIYELNFTKERVINSCNLVFILPDYADGTEKYFVYYDDNEKNPIDYKDHVKIEDDYYKYEPIRGINVESWFYKITQDGYIQYAVSQRGSALNDCISQQVTKLKRKTTSFKPKNAEHLSSFSFDVWLYKGDKEISFSSNEELVTKKVLTDGNLMVKFLITSKSSNGYLKTTNYYKYYFSPNENRRIYVNVNHEIVKSPLPDYDEAEASFCQLNCGGIKSNLEELNSGDIPPFLHLYGENNQIITYEMDTNPESIKWQELIGKYDDYDLGELAWFSADYGEKGNAQALIFDSNDIIERGDNENDGMQIQLYEANSVNLPGLDIKSAYIYNMRNSYEKDEGFDKKLPGNYKIEFNVNFFSTENGGYKRVSKEASIFQSLISYQPEIEKDHEEDDELKQTFSLKLLVDVPNTIYKKIYFSILLLKNTYISAEIYKDGDIKAISRVGWLSFTDDYEIDWKNTSIFSKAIFNNLEQGTYLVKIIVNNVYKRGNNEFIGYKIIDLTEDLTTNIKCKKEGDLNLYFYDQNENFLNQVNSFVYKNDVIFETKTSNSDNNLNIGLPSGFREEYDLKSYYKGFLVLEEKINLGFFTRLIPLKIEKKIDVYDLTVNIDKSFSENINFELFLTSKNMTLEKEIYSDISNSKYIFEKLYPSDYTIHINYNDFRIEKEINIANKESISLNFHNLSVEIRDLLGLPPEAILDVSLSNSKYLKNNLLHPSKSKDFYYYFENLYPGSYDLIVRYKSDVYKKSINIPIKNDKTSFTFETTYNLSLKTRDLRGSIIGNADVTVLRKNFSITKKSDEKGEVFFKLPPGTYECTVEINDNTISKREITLLSDKEISVLTKNEPILPYIILLFSISLIVISILYCYRKKDFKLFIKIFIISLAISSIILPWWNLNCNSSDKTIETSSKLYLFPSEMITFNSYNNSFYGESGSLSKEFSSAINIVTFLIFIAMVFLIVNIILNNLRYSRLSNIFLFLATISFITSLGIFLISMSVFSKAIVGSLFGSKEIIVGISSVTEENTLPCNWGLSYGFYLLVVSTFLAIALFLNKAVRFIRKKFKLTYVK